MVAQKKSIFPIVCGVIMVLFLAAAVPLLIFLLNGSSDGKATHIVIKRGTPVSKVARILEDAGVIEDAEFFKLLLRSTGGSSKVRAGEFEFQKKMRPLSALKTLYYKDPILHQITVPEGWTVRQIAKSLESKGLADKDVFVQHSMTRKAARRYKLTSPTLEGFLFPDTYAFSKTDSEEKMVETMVNRFFEKYKSYESEARRKGYTAEKLVTLASIVEKETGAANERPLIASVFLNRLKKGMRLQSDPTTIYGIKNFDGNLTKRHLQTRTPYNTYKIRGLPIGPIGNPGEDSIKAILRPASSDYLYFVSKNNGQHVFSETYKEHSKNVDYYQKSRRTRRGASRGRK